MGPPPMLPAHCDLTGVLNERTGKDGQHYAIRFHLRLPAEWNGNFFMQGGGGSNGEIGDAVGRLGGGAAPALAQGYAVASQDSGHDNATNSVPDRGGPVAFGFDPQARADYGGASLEPVVAAARAAIQRYYGTSEKYRYFVGCSKGGQEGMMLAQRHPELFDGIVAAAPGFSLPRAAVAEAWDTQSFAAVAQASGAPPSPASLAATFSDGDFRLVGKAILDACDAADGLVDGIVGAFEQCTSAKVLPALAKVTCTGAKDATCLSPGQVTALRRTHGGPRNSKGDALYASFPWDAGWADMGWRMWKIGSADGRVPALNVLLGAPSLATVFTTPPTPPGVPLLGPLKYALAFDFDRDAPRIYATGPGFPRSAWTDIGARSPDLSGFVRRGGRIIVPQGVSDPVFSIADTIAWYRDLNTRTRGRGSATARLFPVPGMAHCGGGPATDSFDAFAPLVRWVEKREAPDRIVAKAGPMSPWPGRTRPLCAYPAVARYKGSGSIEDANNFVCRPTA